MIRRSFNLLLTALAITTVTPVLAKTDKPGWALVLHGGAGTVERSAMTPQLDAAYRQSLSTALAAGTAVLDRGGSALDAVQASIQILEDDPLFNAGRGAVFTAEGRNELDSAIMDGSTLKAGAVAGLTRTRHPIALARAVMEKSPHVMLVGSGAETFGKQQGIEQVDPAWFFTERRWQQLAEVLADKGLPMPPRPAGAPADPNAGKPKNSKQGDLPNEHRFGTVGVAALDQAGHVAAGTSTGGTSGKRWGRVGDTPIIGAGTYAADDSCAVSATGTGEYFIRLTVAREICALVRYAGMPLQQAADEVIQKRLTVLGGDGGIIAVTPDGQTAFSFNTSGMYRARQVQGGQPSVGIFADEGR